MNKWGRFGPLLGAISIGNQQCKFLVYAVRNADILTCHEEKLNQINVKPGWVEYEPMHIWEAVVKCINAVTQNLIILDINPGDIRAIGITNQRETTVLWDKDTGQPLYNAIASSDLRTTDIVNDILSSLRNKKNHIKSVCGLPINTCFSAVKIKWLINNVNNVSKSIDENKCYFGTLDTWVLWNLTGGIECGVHATDVTNASRTMLMDLYTLKWDKRLCNFFKISKNILPDIKSCSEIYGFIHAGPLRGIPIAGCIGDQQASLLGQNCTSPGQITCTYDEGCYLLFNTGQEIIDSDNGLLSTIAFQLGTNAKPFYALEGAVSNAGSSITWLKDNLLINTDIHENDNNFNTDITKKLFTSYNSVNNKKIINNCNNINNRSNNLNNYKNDVIFVPAFNGLYSPHWNYNARGLIIGLCSNTTSHQITLAAYEAICYQTYELLESLYNDCKRWPRLEKIIVGGEYTENVFLLQMLSDLCGITIERPQTTSPSCLGVMLVTGLSMGLLTLEHSWTMYAPPIDIFKPIICSNQREIKYKRWKYAVKKCLNLDDCMNDGLPQYFYQDKDPSLAVRCSIPGGLFIASSFALLIVAQMLQLRGIA